MAATHLNRLLKIIAVAGVFISLILTAVFLVFALVGAAGGEEPAHIWVIVWNSFFLGLLLCGILYGTLTLPRPCATFSPSCRRRRRGTEIAEAGRGVIGREPCCWRAS